MIATQQRNDRAWVPAVPARPEGSSILGSAVAMVVRAAPLLVASRISAEGEGPRRAMAYLALAVAVTIAALVSVRARRMLDRSVWWAGHAVAAAVGFVALVCTEAIALVARVAATATGREAIGWTRVGAGSTWVEPRIDEPRRRRRTSNGIPPPRRRPRLATFGAVVLVVALVDVGAGSIWNRTAQTDAPGETFPFVGAQPPLPPATVPGREDVRAASPAFANSPWAPAYFREFQEQGYETQPFTYTSYRDRSGTYLNIKDNVRVSADADKGPVVWFFGGSSMFGEGQRDDFTIPSQFARMAADDGHPIRVVNFGVQADSNYQSMLRFEQALASRRPLPSLVVFYDGANEISQHLSQPATDQPQLYQGIYAGGPSSPDADDDVWSAWRRTSLLARALGAASGGSADEPPASEDEIVDQILAVYGRGLRLAQSMAADADAGFASFFQPARFYDETPVADAVRADLPPGTVDLSPVLAGAGDEIYMDEVHTNEEGARRVAAAMYAQLQDEVGQL